MGGCRNPNRHCSDCGNAECRQSPWSRQSHRNHRTRKRSIDGDRGWKSASRCPRAFLGIGCYAEGRVCPAPANLRSKVAPKYGLKATGLERGHCARTRVVVRSVGNNGRTAPRESRHRLNTYVETRHEPPLSLYLASGLTAAIALLAAAQYSQKREPMRHHPPLRQQPHRLRQQARR